MYSSSMIHFSFKMLCYSSYECIDLNKHECEVVNNLVFKLFHL